MKRIITFLLLAFTALGVSEAQNFEVNGIEYRILSTAEPYKVGVSTKFVDYTGDIVIPGQVTYDSKVYTVTTIGGGAFGHNRNVTSVVIPNTVTSIEGLAFINCTGLKSISIPKSVAIIEDGPFPGCSNLDSIHVDPDNPYFSSLNGILFSKELTRLIQFPCTKASVEIPNSLTGIGNYAFYSSSLLESVSIPNSVTSIGIEAFFGCTGLKTVTIGNSVTIMGRGVFENCSKLSSVTLGNSLTNIGGVAFEDCIGLTGITIPGSIAVIEEEAFISCTGLSSITCQAVTPPLLGSYVFGNVPKTIPLFVPAESVNAYKAADQWKDFAIYSIATKVDKTKSIELSLYPNPVNNILTVENMNVGATFNLYDEKGAMVFSQILKSQKEMIDLRALPSGVYVVNVFVNGHTKVYKMIRK